MGGRRHHSEDVTVARVDVQARLATSAAMPSSVRKVRISSRMYGGVNIFQLGAST